MQTSNENIKCFNKNFASCELAIFSDFTAFVKSNPFKNNKVFYLKEILSSYWVYHFLIKSELISPNDKGWLQLEVLKSIKYDLNYVNYSISSDFYVNKMIKQKALFYEKNNVNYEVIWEVEDIIQSGFVFSNNKIKFNFLKFIFSNEVNSWLFNSLKDRFRYECFKQIESLNKKAKIFLFNKILKTKDKTTIFNLINFNDFYEEIKNKKEKNFLVFELLKNNLCHKNLIKNMNIEKTNNIGEGFLFYINDGILSQDGITDALKEKLNQLKKEKLDSLVYQINKKNESVMEVLIKNKSIETIKFLLSNDYQIEKDNNKKRIINLLENDESMTDEYWQDLLRVWKIQINYMYISKICDVKKNNSGTDELFKI